MKSNEEIKTALVQAIHDGDDEQAVVMAQAAVEAKISPTHIFDECIVPTLDEVGDKFSRLEIFLPEMMMAADAVKAIFGVLTPVIKAEKADVGMAGKIVIGTMVGDVHDIGKNMVATLLEVSGFEVVDLGTDVPVKSFLDAARQHQADIIAMSSLLTTSLPYMKDLLAVIKEMDPANRFKVMVGGGPVTAEWARQVGADGYGKDASAAVAVARGLMK